MELGPNDLSTRRMLLGITVGAVAGLIAYVVLETGVSAAIGTLVFGYEWKEFYIWGYAKLYLAFGLPLALVLAIAVGRPFWERAEVRAHRSGFDALRYGAAAGATIGIILLLLSLANGFRLSVNPNAGYGSWMYGHQVTDDGLPTLFGWLFELLSLIYFTLAGAIGGLAARWSAFPRAPQI